MQKAQPVDGLIAFGDSRSPGSTALVMFTIIRGPFDGEVTLRRVYDFVDPDAGGATLPRSPGNTP